MSLPLVFPLGKNKKIKEKRLLHDSTLLVLEDEGLLEKNYLETPSVNQISEEIAVIKGSIKVSP